MPIIPWLDEVRTVLKIARHEACELGGYSVKSRQTCES